MSRLSQKRTNPREGIETISSNLFHCGECFRVRKERIPVRGLKRRNCFARPAPMIPSEKNESP